LIKPIKTHEQDLKNWFTYESSIDPDRHKISNGEEIGFKWGGKYSPTAPVVVLIHGHLLCS
jgi:hypothetical protein